MNLRSILLAAVLAIAAAHPAAAQRVCRPADAYIVISTTALELMPGQTQALTVGLSRAPYTPTEALPQGCAARWSVAPGAPARIDARGRLTVRANAAVGAQFQGRAVVGRDTARQMVSVIDPRPNPLAGRWGEVEGSAACTVQGGAADPVRELVFRRNGEFTVTFTPFETYNDYWGHYTFDRQTGALKLTVEHGNKSPDALDLEGTARVVDGKLVLDGMWLGQPNGAEPRTCRYTFAH